MSQFKIAWDSYAAANFESDRIKEDRRRSSEHRRLENLRAAYDKRLAKQRARDAKVIERISTSRAKSEEKLRRKLLAEELRQNELYLRKKQKEEWRESQRVAIQDQKIAARAQAVERALLRREEFERQRLAKAAARAWLMATRAAERRSLAVKRKEDRDIDRAALAHANKMASEIRKVTRKRQKEDDRKALVISLWECGESFSTIAKRIYMSHSAAKKYMSQCGIKLTRAIRIWTNLEKETLLELAHEGSSVQECATHFGRSVSDVESQLKAIIPYLTMAFWWG